MEQHSIIINIFMKVVIRVNQGCKRNVFHPLSSFLKISL